MKRILAGLCALMLWLPGVALAAEKGFPREAIIRSPIATSAGLCELSNEYEYPAAVYFNGTTVRVTEVQQGLGAYPESLSDPTEMWGHVVVQYKGEDTFVSGWVPQICLQYTDEDSTALEKLPSGTLSFDTPLLKDNGLSKDTLGDYKKGTPFTLMGIMDIYFHVIIDGKAGFIPMGALQADKESIPVIEGGRPESGTYSYVMPGRYERFREYQQKLADLMDPIDHVTSNVPFENMAARSALEQTYGYRYMEVIHIVPGEDAMKPEDVAALGEKLLRDKYAYTDRDIKGLSLTYYYKRPDPDTHFWRLVLYAQRPKGNISVEMSASGEPLEYFQGKGYPDDGEVRPSPQEIQQAQQGMEYYQNYYYSSYPKAGDITQEQAQEMARASLQQNLPEGEKADLYQVHTVTFHRHNLDNISWWRVDFKRQDLSWDAPMFQVVVTSPEGNIISADKEGFAHDMQVAAYQQSYQESEKKWGPSNTWTAEVAAKAQPWDFAPPPTEGILLEEALDIARNYLLTTESIPQETLDTWHPQALFTVEDKWYIMFHTDETLKDPELPCYTVRVDNHNGSIELISDFNTNG